MFSKFNINLGLSYSCTILEAIDYVNDCADINETTAKVRIYDKVLGYGNKEEDRKEFEKLTAGTDEKIVEEYIKKYYDKAVYEIGDRIRNLDKRSSEGKTEGVEIPAAVINRILSEDVRTQFTKIPNNPISLNYVTNDDEITVYSKKGYEFVSQPISITYKFRDKISGNETLEVTYFDNLENKIKKQLVKMEDVSKGNFSELAAKGFVFNYTNGRLLTKYLEDILRINLKKQTILQGAGNFNYGFLQKSDGSQDLTKYIGLCDDTAIVSSNEFRELDKNIFSTRGSLAGHIEFLDSVSKVYTEDWMLLVGACLSGFLISIINNGTDTVAPPVIIFTGQTSIGKNLFFAVANNLICRPSKTASLINNSDCSLAYIRRVKSHLYNIFYLVADLQDLINKEGVGVISDMIFNHSLGQTAKRSNSDGSIRTETIGKWELPLICCSEADLFTNNSKFTGGADARFITIPLQVEENDTLCGGNPKRFLYSENENYGWIGKEFLTALLKEERKSIISIFNWNVHQFKELHVQEKNANILALMKTALDLLGAYQLIPDRWIKNAMTCKDIVNYIGIKTIVDPQKYVYELLCEKVLKDVSFVDYDIQISDSDFEERSKTTKEVRGRLYYEKEIGGIWCSCKPENADRGWLCITRSNLLDETSFLQKNYDISGYALSVDEWYRRGWVKKTSDGYLHRATRDMPITRPYDPKARETYYMILLKRE